MEVDEISKTELTKKLEDALWDITTEKAAFGCFEVTIGFATNRYGRVDYMTLDTKDIFRMYEIKVSKSDFHSQAKHTLLGHFNYYVVPDELYQEVKEEIPVNIGVYGYNGRYLVCRKNPKKQELTINPGILKSSMIRSLFREYEKSKESKSKYLMENLKYNVRRLEKENGDLRHENTENITMIRAFEKKYGIAAEDIVKEIFYSFNK
jgi:hypothetical protein